MIVFPVLHGRVHVEPGNGSPAQTHWLAPETRVQDPQRGATNTRARPAARGLFASLAATSPAGRTRSATAASGNSMGHALPDAYIGSPQGDLQSDSQHAGLFRDRSGQSYIAIGNHYYAVHNDAANETWRAIQLQDPAKPGIPIERGRTGNWRVHADVGLPGGRPIPTREQIQNDIVATTATLDELQDRRTLLAGKIRYLQARVREFETVRHRASTDAEEVRSRVPFLEAMAEYFARQTGRGNADPSFHVASERAARDLQQTRAVISGLDRLIEEADTAIHHLQSRIADTHAELHRTIESVVHAAQRIDDLDRFSRELP
jgi:hypothetical protein